MCPNIPHYTLLIAAKEHFFNIGENSLERKFSYSGVYISLYQCFTQSKKLTATGRSILYFIYDTSKYLEIRIKNNRFV